MEAIDQLYGVTGETTTQEYGVEAFFVLLLLGVALGWFMAKRRGASEPRIRQYRAATIGLLAWVLLVAGRIFVH
jgi:hypothetical protein